MQPGLKMSIDFIHTDKARHKISSANKPPACSRDCMREVAYGEMNWTAGRGEGGTE